MWVQVPPHPSPLVGEQVSVHLADLSTCARSPRIGHPFAGILVKQEFKYGPKNPQPAPFFMNQAMQKYITLKNQLNAKIQISPQDYAYVKGYERARSSLTKRRAAIYFWEGNKLKSNYGTI